MARTTTPGIMDRLTDHATMTFIKRGYRGTRIEDVAEAAGLSVGTVYRYFENKDALFELVLRRAFNDPHADNVDAPYTSSDPRSTVEQIWKRLQDSNPLPLLHAAVERPAPPGGVRSEFEEIVREIYRWQFTHWRALKLVERCARDWPELDVLFYKQFRRGLLELGVRHITRRTAEGVMRPTPDAHAAARLVAESCAFFAMHRHTAPDSEMADDIAEETVVTLMTNAFVASD